MSHDLHAELVSTIAYFVPLMLLPVDRVDGRRRRTVVATGEWDWDAGVVVGEVGDRVGVS